MSNRLARPKHTVDQHLVAVVDHGSSTQLALTLGCHLGQDMTSVSALALVSAGSFLKPLGGPTVNFRFWHNQILRI